MKTLLKQSLLYLSIAAMIFTYSCGEDEEELTPNSPTVSVAVKVNGTAATSPATVEVGDEISLDLGVSAPGNFNVFRLKIVEGTTTLETGELVRTDITTVTDFSADFDVTGLQVYTVPEELAGSSFTFEFEIVDDLGQTGSASSFTFNVEEAAVPIVTHTATLLGGQLNPNEDSFYNAVDDATYGYADFRDNNSANTDFCFFYGNTNLYTIAAIDDADANTAFSAAIAEGALSAATIATRNETRFVTTATTAAEFDAISDEAALLAAFGDVSATATKQNELAVGDVFGVQLAASRGSKKGLVKVVEVAGTSGTDRTITIQVKIQE